MILPILRLVLIYFLLVAGVVAVFNRDKLAPLLPGGGERTEASEAAPAEPPAPLAEMPEIEDAPGAGSDAEAAAGDTGPVFPEPSDLETPVAPEGAADTAAPAPVVTPAPGIAPEPQPLQVTPADEAVASATVETPVADAPSGEMAATAVEPVFPEAPAADTASPAPTQPARPGSPAPLGTPVASAPAAEAPAPAPEAPATAQPAADPAPAPATTAPAAAPAPAPQAPAEPAAPATARDMAAAPHGADDTALAEALAAMRAAYWGGDLDAARAQAEALAAAHPDNPEIAGELGNLAFAQRDYPAAAEAWHKAGLMLIERGEAARVMSFNPILQSIDPDKAAELAARVQER